jgi:hypothetical protein
MAQHRHLGRLRGPEELAFEAVESMSRGKEAESAAVADDDAGLHCDAHWSGSNFNNVTVEHESLPPPALVETLGKVLGLLENWRGASFADVNQQTGFGEPGKGAPHGNENTGFAAHT